MSYIRIKTIKGRQYKYLVTGKRTADGVQQKVLKYLGPVEPVYLVQKPRKKPNASIYIRNLTSEEQAKLVQKKKSKHAFTRDRAIIILHSAEKTPALNIAKKLKCDVRKVRNAIKAFNKKGLKALQQSKAKGAIPKFTDEVKEKILSHFAKKPMDIGYHFTIWTLPRFTKHLINHKVVDTISIEKVRQIIMEAGGKLKRSKRWQYSPDKQFLKKNKQ